MQVASGLNEKIFIVLNQKKDTFSVKGAIDQQILFKVPFPDINNEGLTGVFSMEQAA